MSWYRTGTVAVTNGSKTVTGVGTLFTTAVNVGDAFALVDANLNPTGAWYEVDVVVSNTELTLKQSYAGTTGSNNQYSVFNLVGNMTTPSFAQRLAAFFASFQALIDKPTVTPTAASIPLGDTNGKIDSGWVSDTSTTVKGVVKVGTNLSATNGVISVPDASSTVKGVDWRRSPVGAIVTISTDDVPTHCLECNGAEISRETYSELFAVIGAVYGAGDGSTTFKIPDLRGEFIRGWDNARGIDASRAIGSAQADAFKSHYHSIPAIYPGSLGSSGYIPFAGSTGTMDAVNTMTTGGTETRPRNVAMMYCIVYE